MEKFVVVPGPRGDRFVELSRSQTGRVFRKQILKWGKLLYPDAPGGVVDVDQTFADTLITNFANGVADIVQVPKVGKNNEHTEDPDRNIGEVIKVYKLPKGVYVDLDVRTSDADKMGKTLLGGSAMMHLDYTDTNTGKRVGPTLLHEAVTNRPYITDLDGYEEIIAASAAGADTENQVLVLTSADEKENDFMTLEEMLAALKADHGIDVAALQLSAAKADASVALSNKIQEELVSTGLLTLSNTDEPVTADVLIGAVAEAGKQIVALTSTVDGLVKTAAETSAATEVEALINSGHILPKKREAMITLKLSNAELFTQLVPEKPIVKLSQEEGDEIIDEGPDATVAAEVERLSKVAVDKAYIRK